MYITKNKIFFEILIFGLIVNLLVFFDIQYLYLRAIFSFIFLITIPGLLIMLMLKVRKIGFWEYFCYSIGLSITFLMFGGLFINWTLPLVGIDKPLSLVPLLVSFNIFLLIFWLIAFKRNEEISLKIKLPKLSWLNKVFFAIPVIFIFLSIFGATMLNNNGSNYLTMSMLAGIAIYVFLAVLLKDKLNKHIYPFAILNISLALLLATSLRSRYVFGSDITTEYFIFQLTKKNFYWSMLNFPHHSYNACLSITILPTILNSFLNINEQYIFKILYQPIFIFTSVGIFLTFKRYVKTIFAFLASCFFIFTPAFFIVMPMHTREEIALLYFSLILLVLFNEKIDPKMKNILFLVFGFSMVVSHYSTTYIALSLFILTWIVSFIFRKKENHKIFSKLHKKINLKENGRIPKNKNYYFRGTSIFLLFIFTFLWIGLLTETSGNLVEFTRKTITNMTNIFKDDVRSVGSSPLNQFNIFYKPNLRLILSNHVEETISKYDKEPNDDFYREEEYKFYSPEIVPQKTLPVKLNLNTLSKIYLFMEIIKKLVKIFIIIGVIYLIFSQLKKRQINQEYIILNIISFLLLGIIIILPFATLSFSLDRAYSQLLIILSFSTVLGGLILFKFFKRRLRIIFVSGVFLLYFLFLSGFIPQILGGAVSSVQMNNSGSNYNFYYTHNAEIKSGQWLFDNYRKSTYIYMDSYAGYKSLLSYKFELQKWIKRDIFPQVIRKSSYVYLSSSNITEESIFAWIRGTTVGYSNPLRFLNENKDLIYNNKYSEIFK
jgi:uncharacterized membrane protein